MAKLQRLARAVDRHPVIAALILTAILFLGLLVWGHFASDPVLLARTGPDDRTRLYTQFTGAATALLATSLTVLSLLLALSDRPAIEELRGTRAWPRIQGFLLCTAVLCLITLVMAFVGSAADHSVVGREWLSSLVTVTGTMSVVSLLIGGLVFGLSLRLAEQEDDPSKGRGAGHHR